MNSTKTKTKTKTKQKRKRKGKDMSAPLKRSFTQEATPVGIKRAR